MGKISVLRVRNDKGEMIDIPAIRGPEGPPGKDAPQFEDIIGRIYPVGAVYISVTPVNPEVLFGGTWEQLKDRFLLSAGDAYEAGTIGGEAEHTLTVEEMPAHTHPIWTKFQNNDSGTDYAIRGVADYDKSNWWTYDYTSTTEATGGDQPHNNMPPYLAVYMWKRTA